jgi:hypothetical protein
MQIPEATEVSEPPARGCVEQVAGHQVQVTSRNKLIANTFLAPINSRRSRGTRVRGGD